MSGRSHTLVVQSKKSDPRNAVLLIDAHALGLEVVTDIRCRDLYFIEGDLAESDLKRLAAELLSDPVAQTAEWRDVGDRANGASTMQVIETARRPGVTDSVAEQIVRAAHELGISAVQRAATGNSYQVGGGLAPGQLRTLAERLLANAVIHHYQLGAIEPTFPQSAEGSARVDIIPLREFGDNALLALSRDRRAALDIAEMRAVQKYFSAEGRDPTDVEFEMIAQTWSEHCVHKTFRAKIDVTDGSSTRVVNGLLKTFLVAATDTIAAPWVRSAFVDNAGIMDFDDDFEISIKVETHNHPSAIEPFGGANTGVGGVIRDVLGVSAKPIAAIDVLCFGPADLDPASLPDGVLHPRRIRSGVVAGVQDYGNKIGIPTVNGAILYDEGYTANPLVFCGCIGIAPKGKHATTRQPLTDDRVIVLGGRTGSDGLRGATFSSMTMDAQTGEVAGASVQIGDPITENGLIEVVTRARDLDLYHAITDCGAGGLSSAVGEMASTVGADVELTKVRLKYPGLAPWEIWLSEAQERMVLAVPEPSLPRLQSLCDTYDVELTNIGHFSDTGRLAVRYNNDVVLDLDNTFLHNGIPQRQMTAVIERSHPARSDAVGAASRADVLLRLLATPNVASKSDVIRIYDHEILGGTVVKPLTGVLNDGPSDACVIKPIGTKGARGIVISNGINPDLGKIDAYSMALNVVDEAIRNAVAVGGNPARIAILDNFCWGDPTRPATLGSLVEAVRGCHDAAVHFGTPFISGKDSLNNEYLGTDGERHAIPPTLLISALGIVDDVAKSVTMDLKAVGNTVYLVGSIAPTTAGQLPAADLYLCLHRAMQACLIRACHDLSEGGMAVAAAEMCIGGRVGLSLMIEEQALFTETNGCLLVEVHPDDVDEFERTLAGQPHQRLGVVADTNQLEISSASGNLLAVPVDQLVAAWNAAA